MFQSLAFRSGVAGQNQLNGIITSVITPTFTLSSLDRRPARTTARSSTCSSRSPAPAATSSTSRPRIAYRQFFPMKGLKVNREGHNVLGYRVQLAHVDGFGGEVAPPTSRIYGGGESDVRGFDVRASSPLRLRPEPRRFQPHQPGRLHRPARPDQPALGNIPVPLPVYRLVSIGGDTQLTSNVEYRIPIVNQVTFAFFTDFGMTFNLQDTQLKQSASGLSTINEPRPTAARTFVNGACFGGQQVTRSPQYLKTVPGSNYVPRMSNGAELQVILPDRQRAIPDLLRLQPAATLQEPAAAARPPQTAPAGPPASRACSQHRCRPVQLPAGGPALRRGLRPA